MKEVEFLIIRDKLISKELIDKIEISLNDRELDILDLTNIYRIRYFSEKDNKVFQKLFEIFSNCPENLKVRFVKIRGKVNMNLFVDSLFTKIIAIVPIATDMTQSDSPSSAKSD